MEYLKRVVGSIVVAGALGACGGGGDDPKVKCSSAPTLSVDAAPTTATVGKQVAAWYEARYQCLLIMTCYIGVNIMQGPPGVGADPHRPVVYWTPTAEYAGKTVGIVFATEADTCNNTATATWSFTVQHQAAIQSFEASARVVDPGQSVMLTPVFSGVGHIEGLGMVASGVAVSTLPLAQATEFRLVVEQDGVQVAKSLAVDVRRPMHD